MEETDGDRIEFLKILTEKLYVRVCQVRLFFWYKQMKLGITSQELNVYAQNVRSIKFGPIFSARKQGRIDFSWNKWLAYKIFFLFIRFCKNNFLAGIFS